MQLGFIGIGKIAGAVIEGLCTSSLKDSSIYLSPRNEANGRVLAEKYANITRLETNQQVLDHADIIFIAVRPAVAKEVLGALNFTEKHTVISLIPLLKCNDLTLAVAPAKQVSRAIPLPTVMIHNCPIPVYQANDQVISIFGHIGQPLIVPDEEQLHAIWTLTGLITPFYDLLGELSNWTTAHGVSEEIANQYIANLFQSLSLMAQKANPIDFEELAKHAATPNGMNEQAGKEIREKGGHEMYRIASDNLLVRFR